MKKGTITKSFFIAVTLIIGFFLFYIFMTYDRSYNWAKEFEEDVKNVVGKSSFILNKNDKINIDSIRLPVERNIKISIQKILYHIGIMKYRQEYGIAITCNSLATKEKIICKGWCLGDHLIGVEIDHIHLTDIHLKYFQNEFNKQFYNYKIIWVQEKDK